MFKPVHSSPIGSSALPNPLAATPPTPSLLAFDRKEPESQPSWPGLNPADVFEPAEHSIPSQPTTGSAVLPAPDGGGTAPPPTQPSGRKLGLGTVLKPVGWLVVLGGLGIAALLMRQHWQERFRSVQSKPGGAAKNIASLPPLDSPDIMLKPDGTPMTDKERAAAELSRHIDLASEAAILPVLVRRLFDGPTLEDRLACITEPQRYRSEVEAFFKTPADGGPAVQAIGLQRFPITPYSLPGNDMTPMFQVVTNRNPAGALARLIESPDGQHLLFWPMFAETHAGSLDKFLDAPEFTEARWFYTGLRRNHGLELSETERSTLLTFDVQASGRTRNPIHAYADRTTPVGRFLDNEMQWLRVYVGRVLLGWTGPRGDRRLTILDCEGLGQESSVREPAAADRPN